MGRIILFVRVSTIGQQLESQEDSLKRAALADGYNETDFIIIGKKESAIKLSEEEREGLNELKSIIEKEIIDCIYIAELSRLSRQPKILYSIRDLLFQKKIQLKCLHPQFSLLSEDRTKYDPTANIIFSLFGALAEQEMIEKKERFARGKQRKAQERKYNGGAIPYGYRVDKERDNLIVVNEDEAKIVRLIFDLYEAGFSQPKLAREMRKRGYNHVTISMINNILNNASYCGIKKKSVGASYERSYDPIISKEQFDKCRSIANSNNTTISKSRNIYYADKLVRCSTCGGYWSASGSKNSYHCTTAYRANSIWRYENHYKDKCKDKTSLSINVLDSILWHYSIERECVYILNQNENTIKLYEEAISEIKLKLANIEPRRDELQSKKERLREMYIDGMSKESYNKKKEEIDNALTEIKAEEIQYKNELSNLDNKISFIKRKNPGIWSKRDCEQLIQDIINIADDKERYDIIHRQVKSVEVLSKRANYPFRIGRKDIIGKYIIVHGIPILGFETFELVDNDVDICSKGYFSIPNGGNGALILELSDQQDDQSNHSESIYIYDDGKYYSYKEIQDKIYLNRYYDVTKKATREKEREEKARVIGDRLSLKELSDLCGLSYITLYNKVKKGEIKAIMEYGKYLIDQKDAIEISERIKEKRKKD